MCANTFWENKVLRAKLGGSNDGSKTSLRFLLAEISFNKDLKKPHLLQDFEMTHKCKKSEIYLLKCLAEISAIIGDPSTPKFFRPTSKVSNETRFVFLSCLDQKLCRKTEVTPV